MKQPYRLGELREVVTVRRYVESTNDYGTVARNPIVMHGDVPAHVRPMRGDEIDRGQQTEARRMYLVVIRYRSGITEKDYIVWRDEEMNIRAVLDRGPRAMFLELECERGAP